MKQKKCIRCKKAEVDIRYQGVGYCFACAKKEEWYERLVREVKY